MKSNSESKHFNYSLLMMGILFTLTSSEGYTGTMGPAVSGVPGTIYVGVFGGGGASTKTGISQFGTAFYADAVGGPLSVNAFGTSNRRTVGLVGGQIGYQWAEILANPLNAQWSLAPAFELEGYYLGKSTLTGHDINNETVRLPEHDFLVTYPISTGVFLTNAVLKANIPNSRFHPYAGVGIGAAVISISDAQSIQVAPPETPNHYNRNPNNTQSAFAGQAKAGLNFDLTQNASVFVEYRWLYLANTEYTFGSTVFPGHVATSPWTVNIGGQDYNMGAIGLQYRV